MWVDHTSTSGDESESNALDGMEARTGKIQIDELPVAPRWKDLGEGQKGHQGKVDAEVQSCRSG